MYGTPTYGVNDTLFVVGQFAFGSGTSYANATSTLWVYDLTAGDMVPVAIPTGMQTVQTPGTGLSGNASLASFVFYSTPSGTSNRLGANGVQVDELRVGSTWSDIIGLQSLYWDIDGFTAGAGGANPSGTWDSSTTNWSGSSAGSVATQAWIDNFGAVFSAGSNATGAYTITVSGTQSAASVTFEDGTPTLTGGTLNLSGGLVSANTGVTATIASDITGSAGLNKTGNGVVVLSGTNTYGSSTTVSAGTLQFGKTFAMPASGDVTVNAGSTLAVSAGGTDEWTNSTDDSVGGTIASVIKGRGGQGTADQIAWTDGSILGIDTSNAGGTMTYTGVIGDFRTDSGTTNNVGVATLGTGTLALSNANTYSGGTFLGGGVLEVSSDGNLGDAAGSITFRGTSTLRFTSSISTSRNVTVSAVGTVDTPVSTDSTLSGVISGTSTLIKSGSGTLRITAANTLTGSMRSSAGTLMLMNDHALQNAALDMNGADTGSVIFDNSLTSITLGGLTGSRNFSANSAASLTVGNNNKTAGPYSGVLGGTGSLTKIGTGTQTISGNNTYSGGTNINAGTLQFGQTIAMPASGNVTVGSTLAVNVGGAGEWANSTDDTVGGTIASIIKGRGGRGTANQVSWSPGSSLGIDTTNAGGTLTYSGTIGGFRSVTVSGDYNHDSKVDAADYVVWRKSDGSQSGYDTWRANFGATATGTTNNVGLTKLGAGTLELTGTNTYTGPTTIGVGTAANQSILLNGTSTALDPNTLVTFASNANPENRWELHDSVGNPVDATVRGLSGGGLNSGTGTSFVDATNLVLGLSTLTLNVPTGESYTYNGYVNADYDIFSDVHGTIIKNGNGEMDFNRNNGTSGFDGEFVINAGTIGIGDNQVFGATASATARLTINGGTLKDTIVGTSLNTTVKDVRIGGDFSFEINGGSDTQFNGDGGQMTITLQADNPTITVIPGTGASSGNLIFAGDILNGSGATDRGFTKAGAGNLTLGGPNSDYRGQTTILAGSLRVRYQTNSKNIGWTRLGDGNGRVNLSGGTLEYNGSAPTNSPRTFTLTNPVRVTANSQIAYDSTTTGLTGTTDPGGVVFEFNSNSIDTTGGTLTLVHLGSSQGITFRPTFSGSDFTYTGPVVIDNGGGSRKTVMQSTNTSGVQTWSGDISGTGSFLRDGVGETILSGNNSYAGDTTVLAGLLSITHPYLASSADVQLSTGGKLDLNFTGTDTIDQLFFDGVATSLTGTWGSTSSGATHQDDSFFSGMGMLMVTNPAGSGSSLESASVPEPGALSLMMFAIGSALAFRRRRT